MNQKFNKGITLIALVITIIVLLILAGVTISMVLGDDGIIAQAQNAKTAQEKAEEKEQEEIQKGQGNIDLYTAGTVASTVKVGDYVEYNYTEDQYNTDDTADIGSSQKFDSGATTTTGGVKAAKVTAWRVLSKKDGIIKLVAETPVSSLTLSGANGWVNGPKVLNEMCKTLYSSSIGTARSIDADDVNEITGYDGTKNEKLTIKEAAKTAGTDGAAYDITNFGSNTPEEGKDLGDYEIGTLDYDGAEVMDESSYPFSDEHRLIFGDYEYIYWLANNFAYPNYSMNYVEFRVNKIFDGYFSSWPLLRSKDEDEIEVPNYAFRPVITLKTGLEIDTNNPDNDGKTEGTAWEIKGN